MNFDPVKYVKETFSCDEYVYEINFDPLARRHIFSHHVFKMKFDPLSKCSKNELCSTFVPMIALKI